jgi:pimeloyl-ACP methyl ester carboxylesterase
VRILFWSVIACTIAGFVVFLSLAVLMGFLFPRSDPIALGPGDLQSTVGGTRIRYRTVGTGTETLILLHGFGNRLESWLPVAEHLSCGRAILIDIPGFGGSDRPDGSYDLESQRLRLVGLMDVLGVDRAVLVGASMGGSLAAWTAAHSPERVKTTVLFAPSGYPGSLRYGILRDFLQRPGLGNHIASITASSPVFKWLFPNSLAAGAVQVVGSYSQSYAESLHLIEAPTLILWSSGDWGVPISFANRYLESIRDATLIILPPEAGHLLSQYKPAEQAERICSFLAEKLVPDS